MALKITTYSQKYDTKNYYSVVKANHFIRILLLLIGLAGASCSERKLHEAQAVVAAADSLRAEGQTYTDSVSLAEAYRTLNNWQWSHADEYVHACYHYGRMLREKDNPVEAMQVFINATHSRSRDYHILGRLYSNMGTLCHLAGEYDLSYDMYEHSANMFLSNGDTLLYYYGLNNMAIEWATQGKKEGTLSIINIIQQQCTDSGVLLQTYETTADLYRAIEKFDSAIYWINQTEQYDYITPLGIIIKAQCFYRLGVSDSALYYAQLILLDSTSIYQDRFNALYIISHCDSTLSSDNIRDMASQREDIRYYEYEPEKELLTIAVQLLGQDLNRKPDIRWLYVLIGIITLAGGVIGLSYTYRRSRQMKNSAKNQRKVLEQKCDALMHLSDKQLKDTIYWHDYAALSHFINVNLNNIVNKLLQLIPTLTEQNIRLCIVILLGCSYSHCADMLRLSKSSISKLKQIMAEKLGTDIKNLRATLLDIACKNG